MEEWGRSGEDVEGGFEESGGGDDTDGTPPVDEWYQNVEGDEEVALVVRFLWLVSVVEVDIQRRTPGSLEL